MWLVRFRYLFEFFNILAISVGYKIKQNKICVCVWVVCLFVCLYATTHTNPDEIKHQTLYAYFEILSHTHTYPHTPGLMRILFNYLKLQIYTVQRVCVANNAQNTTLSVAGT